MRAGKKCSHHHLFLCIIFPIASIVVGRCAGDVEVLGLMRRNAAFVHRHHRCPSNYRIKERNNCPVSRNEDEVRRASFWRGAKTDDDDGSSNMHDNVIVDAQEVQPKSREEWIDGKQMMQILARQNAEEQRRKEIEDLDQQLQQKIRDGQIMQQYEYPKLDVDKSKFISRISYTDANTLQIEIPPTGLNANAVATGALSALWFSAVAPATISMLSAGAAASALFMVPFWLAGGVVAKTAVYDPFISSSLSIGQYLWTLEKKYLKKMGSLKATKEEQSTESLKGASVDLAMVVNNVGVYQLRLFFDDNASITFGKGMAREELEYISRVIDDHLEMLQESFSS